MDTNSTAIFAQRARRRAARNVAVVGVVSCLAVTGFAAAVHGAGAASSTPRRLKRCAKIAVLFGSISDFPW